MLYSGGGLEARDVASENISSYSTSRGNMNRMSACVP